MQVNIIVPYRPLSLGHLSTPLGEQHQLPDGSWTGWVDKGGYDTAGVRDLFLTIKFLNKNSVFKHKIIVAIDSDVYPNDNFLKEFENVTVIKSSLSAKKQATRPYWRLNAAYKDAINSIPDEEWICHGFTADLVCSKNWDKPVMDAISRYGDNYVYVPMFVEVYSGWFNGINFKGHCYTPNLIWDEWRKKVCCHALTMPEPEKGYVTEQDFDEYIKVANEAKKEWVIERPG
ncbi:MAG: hypothetical protein Q8P40_16265, partial [Nitrospirota bacterium]|nr:hypothetical protein [Nitrospirota bacterium]